MLTSGVPERAVLPTLVGMGATRGTGRTRAIVPGAVAVVAGALVLLAGCAPGPDAPAEAASATAVAAPEPVAVVAPDAA
ncbi:hypothetical protein EBM89_17410, partial [Cellulomonas triticagri]